MFNFLRKTALYIVAVPLLTLFLGIASNQAVLNANNDTFPVKMSAAKIALLAEGDTKELEVSDAVMQGGLMILPDGKIMLDPVHCLMTKDTHLNFLADEYDLGSIYSIGDFLIMLGEWALAPAPFVWAFVVIGKLRNQREEY
jgi:hypothetical protein